ncbi:hypothetical protein [Pseudarthrobacter sp. ATCC 49987]|uniref:hypothetical protein n=1 Tax=Pseudarthrobacter sp. ATCC 49987 TaxID=2698204 RepID=UPI00136F9C7C|nr:hypothetical protein [Pseudarthrobacter sp. ATCC 49987]
MNRRAPDAPGPAVPYMTDTCGHDAGITDGPVCRNRATVHLLAGEAPDKPRDWTMSACPDHLPQAMLIAYDWHVVSPACQVPGATWQSGNCQGEGFCFWPEAEAIMHEELERTGSDEAAFDSHQARR